MCGRQYLRGSKWKGLKKNKQKKLDFRFYTSSTVHFKQTTASSWHCCIVYTPICVSALLLSSEDEEEERLISNQQKTHADMQTQPERGYKEVWLYVDSHKSTSVMNTHTAMKSSLLNWTSNPHAERNLQNGPRSRSLLFYFLYFTTGFSQPQSLGSLSLGLCPTVRSSSHSDGESLAHLLPNDLLTAVRTLPVVSRQRPSEPQQVPANTKPPRSAVDSQRREVLITGKQTSNPS